MRLLKETARSWHIRSYRDGDEEQILKLRRAVFGDLDPVRLKKSTWLWQFQNNPSGKAVCFLAEAKGEIVGQYVTIPTRFSIRGKETRAAFSCDTMIHPEYRRQGMFSALAREVYDHLETRRNIHLVWGFPNDRSLPGFTGKLDWRMLPTLPLMVMPIRPLGMIFPGSSLRLAVVRLKTLTVIFLPSLILMKPLTPSGKHIQQRLR